MKKCWRSVAVALALCLFHSATGCVTGRQAAEESGSLLYPGMTMDEVAAQLGEPAQVVKGEPGTETYWIYRFEGGPSPAAVVLAIIFFVAVIAVLVLAKGGGSIGGGGGGNDPPYQIRVHFDGKGYLIDVSPPYPIGP